VGAALAVIGAVFAEWVGASDGLGYLILTFNNQTATGGRVRLRRRLAAIGIALFLLVLALERLLLPGTTAPAATSCGWAGTAEARLSHPPPASTARCGGR